MQRHRLPGGKHQALELQGQCYKSTNISPNIPSIFNKMTLRRVTDSPSQVAALAESNRDRTCQHGRFQPYCKACKGNMLCVHLRHKNRCAACRRSSAMSTSASGGNYGVVFQWGACFLCACTRACVLWVCVYFMQNTDGCRRYCPGCSHLQWGICFASSRVRSS